MATNAKIFHFDFHAVANQSKLDIQASEECGDGSDRQREKWRLACAGIKAQGTQVA